MQLRQCQPCHLLPPDSPPPSRPQHRILRVYHPGPSRLYVFVTLDSVATAAEVARRLRGREVAALKADKGELQVSVKLRVIFQEVSGEQMGRALQVANAPLQA
jgi:hypothetical protein